MPVKLYYLCASPPARAVLLALKYLNVPYEVKEVNLLAGEQRSEEFVEKNPQHTVPVIEDEDGFVVSDSHAINGYLAAKYGKGDELYPSDLKLKSVVDNRLFFDTGVLFQAVRFVSKAFFFDKVITGMNQKILNMFEDSYGILDKYCTASRYIAANHVTIADFSVLTTLGNMNFLVPVNEEKFPNLAAYMKRGNATIPHVQELNEKAMEHLKVYFKDFNFEVSD